MSLRPHQKPILTRFAFVMPMCGALPCEPADADRFRVMGYDPATDTFAQDEVYEKDSSAYRKAQRHSLFLDGKIARQMGVPR